MVFASDTTKIKYNKQGIFIRIYLWQYTQIKKEKNGYYLFYLYAITSKIVRYKPMQLMKSAYLLYSLKEYSITR
jgi:hypothetical protein